MKSVGYVKSLSSVMIMEEKAYKLYKNKVPIKYAAEKENQQVGHLFVYPIEFELNLRRMMRISLFNIA